MKYRSFSLNGNKRYNHLIKYDNRYQLDELREMNKDLANLVESCPKIFSELSETQSYMIRAAGTCVGAIYIETSPNERDLEIVIQFIEKYFESKTKMVELLEQIIESLKLYFWDKENIEIELNHNIDLSQINSYKYQKKVYDENITTYICSNKLNNILFPKLVNEMIGAERYLTNLGQSWTQNLKMSQDYDYPLDKKLLEEIYNGSLSIPEMFYKVESIVWPSINSINSRRLIDFSRNGQVQFVKKSKKENGIDYEFNYNVLSDNFNFKTTSFIKDENLEIEDNGLFTNIKSVTCDIFQLNENKRKRIIYSTPIIDYSSVSIELWFDENGIERCYIDFRTHKGKKISGIYALRLFPKNNIFSLRFINRKGAKYNDFSQALVNDDEELYSTILNGRITMETVAELIKKVIPIINRSVDKSNRHGNNKKYISELNNSNIMKFLVFEKQLINFVKQIKDEIPLPHLKESLEQFIENNDKDKKGNKQKTLRR